MPILFFTKNLDKTRYRRVILRCVWETYNYDRKKALKFLKLVKIKLYPLSATKLEFFEHFKTTSAQKLNPKMPSGHAGKYEVTVFLHDTKLTSLGFRFRENVERLGHELDHEILFVEGKKDHVTPVHNRNYNKGKFSFWFWTLKPYRRIPITIIDVRDLV